MCIWGDGQTGCQGHLAATTCHTSLGRTEAVQTLTQGTTLLLPTWRPWETPCSHSTLCPGIPCILTFSSTSCTSSATPSNWLATARGMLTLRCVCAQVQRRPRARGHSESTVSTRQRGAQDAGYGDLCRLRCHVLLQCRRGPDAHVRTVQQGLSPRHPAPKWSDTCAVPLTLCMCARCAARTCRQWCQRVFRAFVCVTAELVHQAACSC